MINIILPCLCLFPPDTLEQTYTDKPPFSSTIVISKIRDNIYFYDSYYDIDNHLRFTIVKEKLRLTMNGYEKQFVYDWDFITQKYICKSEIVPGIFVTYEIPAPRLPKLRFWPRLRNGNPQP